MNPTYMDVPPPDNIIDSELELIIRKLMTDTQSATATHEAIGWDETKVAPDMRRIEKEAAHTITNLIAQEAKAFGGCRNCYGKGYATVRKGTTAKGKTWDLRTHINYCSCDRGKQLQQVMAQEANKATAGIVKALTDKGSHPAYHDEQLRYLETHWPTLYFELKKLITAEKGSNE